jgi:signal transduction histidine kinase
VVSHDIRNPLSVAQARTDLARGECDSDHLADVERAHDRIETLIEDLLTLTREGSDVTDPELVALGDIVDGCWAIVETADATLVSEADRTVSADRSRLKQLFENLIRNAVDHGGSAVTVTVSELSDGFYLADDGPGIPADTRDEVFEPGFSTRDEGTGFGLSIVHEIVEAHGWEIEVAESAAGGARFEVTGVDVAAP